MEKKPLLKLYNTESRKKEEIVPIDSKAIRLYTCGPTVYDFAHIGNFRTYIFEDLLRKTLEYFGYCVTQVMNITDIDDKTIKGALSKNITLFEYTEPFRQSFFDDLNALDIKKAEHYPKATQYIEKMIEIILNLLEKGKAYKGSDGSIYFSIDKFESYGRLSHLDLNSLEKGASERVILDEYDKENAADFVLWKSYEPIRDGNIFWDSPFGKGRPGWHIECSAMALTLLGNTIDLHCGGVDNIFPHHENEIAQSESFTGQRFVAHWAHSEHLIVDGKKMSKSLGNFFTLRDLIKMGYSGREIRFLLINSHYRSQLNFTLDGLQAAKSSLSRIDDFIDRLSSIKEHNDFEIDSILSNCRQRFIEALSDDLNASSSFAVLFDLIREINKLIDENKISHFSANQILDFLKEIDQVLCVIFEKDQEEKIPDEITAALEKRNEARSHKNFQLADELRDYIHNQGYVIEDLAEGARLKKK